METAQRRRKRKNPVTNLFNPVEKNLFVSMYGIDVIPNQAFGVQFSLANIEGIIEASGAHIDGKLSNFSSRETLDRHAMELGRMQYIAMLSESTASTCIFPQQRYASFFLSTCGEADPLHAMEPLVYLFRPVKAEVRYFTSTPIDQVFEDEMPSDDDLFWEQFDEKVPYYYDLKSKEKEIKGIYFDLVSSIHDAGALPLALADESETDPVEDNLVVSMYGVTHEKLAELMHACAVPALENIILKSNNRVVGRMSKELPALGHEGLFGFSYVSQLGDGVAAFHVSPESNYASFFISGSSQSEPILSLKALIEVFQPRKAEVRYFSSSSIREVDAIKYRPKAFWRELDKADVPDNYRISNTEKLLNEFYFDLSRATGSA